MSGNCLREALEAGSERCLGRGALLGAANTELQTSNKKDERETGFEPLPSRSAPAGTARQRLVKLIMCDRMSGKRGSNPRPAAWEAAALPTELLPLKVIFLLPTFREHFTYSGYQPRRQVGVSYSRLCFAPAGVPLEISFSRLLI
jgi:hypothetical protein